MSCSYPPHQTQSILWDTKGTRRKCWKLPATCLGRRQLFKAQSISNELLLPLVLAFCTSKICKSLSVRGRSHGSLLLIRVSCQTFPPFYKKRQHTIGTLVLNVETPTKSLLTFPTLENEPEILDSRPHRPSESHTCDQRVEIRLYSWK